MAKAKRTNRQLDASFIPAFCTVGLTFALYMKIPYMLVLYPMEHFAVALPVRVYLN